MLIETTATEKIRKMKKRVRVVQGGQGASKTYSILMLLIDAATRSKLEIVVIGKELAKMKFTVVKDFRSIMSEVIEASADGMYKAYSFDKSASLATLPNGSTFKFVGLSDDKALGKGLRPDIVYINEANKFLDKYSYNQLQTRVRGCLYMDFNPDTRFFIHDEIHTSPNIDFLTLTYKDNERCPQSEVNAILEYKAKAEAGGADADYYLNLWNVFGLGQIGVPINVVFNFARSCDALPETHKKRVFGLDFGFTNDPSVIVETRLYEGSVWAKVHTYGYGLFNSDLIGDLRRIGVTRSDLIVCDSANPKDIAEIKRAGFNAISCVKGGDVIESDIKTLMRYGLHITGDSLNAWKEQGKYARRENGTIIDADNHFFDALRYASQGLLNEGGFKVRN